MSVEQKQGNQGLRDAMVQSLQELVRQNSQLAGRVLDAIENGQLDDRDLVEILAALQFTEELSRTSRTLIESRGDIIFSKEQIAAEKAEKETINFLDECS